jgi:hypothetical protein
MFQLTSKDASKQCPVRINKRTGENIFYHDLNAFVLSTWGTEVTEGCFHKTVLTLKAGVYLIEWSGKCSLCTRQHCIKGVLQTGSSLRLREDWQAFKIPTMENFSNYDLDDRLEKLNIPDVMALDDLASQRVPSFQWSDAKTSNSIDIIIFLVIVTVCAIVGMKLYCARRDVKDKIATLGVAMEAIKPMAELEAADEEEEREHDKPLTPAQAVAILSVVSK